MYKKVRPTYEGPGPSSSVSKNPEPKLSEKTLNTPQQAFFFCTTTEAPEIFWMLN